jgi:serine/threonine-protein kinase
LGGFRLLRRIAEGGMSTVYAGYDPAAGRSVAVKVLTDKLARQPQYRSRFEREARFCTLLDHPHIVRGLATGHDEAADKHFIVLEYVDGPTAQQLLDVSGPLAVGDAVRLTLDIARALEHLHTRNLVHRDIKPDNILISPAGVPKLADLGLVKRLGEETQLTAVHDGFGTSYYMPYEQALNACMVDGRSDLYALGASLYHLLTAQVPFAGADHNEIVANKAQGSFAPARTLRPEIPKALDLILCRLLARDPRARIQTASELIVELERTRLAAEVPSFTDRELALKDPLVRARLESGGQPTRPNLQVADSRPATDKEIWFIRYRVASGSWRTRRATAEQILYWCRAGRLPAAVVASRGNQGRFRPLRDYPEFRSLPSLPEPSVPLVPPPTKPNASAPTWRQTFLSNFMFFVGGAVGMTAVFAASAFRHCVWPT